MAEALRDLPYTLVDSSTPATLNYSDGSSELVLIVNGVSRHTPSFMPSKREDGIPFIDHIPTQDELYGLGARAAHATHWASSDQIPHVLVLKQKVDMRDKIDADGQTCTVKADLQMKQLVRASVYINGRYPRDNYRFYMDNNGALYMVSV